MENYEFVDLEVDLPPGIKYDIDSDFAVKLNDDFEIKGTFHRGLRGNVYEKQILVLFLFFRVWRRGKKERFYATPYFLGTVENQRGWINQKNLWVSFYELNEEIDARLSLFLLEIVEKVYCPQ